MPKEASVTDGGEAQRSNSLLGTWWPELRDATCNSDTDSNRARRMARETSKPKACETKVCFCLSQTRRDDNKTKMCVFERGWARGSRGELSKTLFFVGNAMTIKF